jgi:hypothetical protein
VPVNQSDGPLAEGCEPLRLISIVYSFFVMFETEFGGDDHLESYAPGVSVIASGL